MSRAACVHESENYRAYLLRLSRGDATDSWLIVAKDVETGEEYPFANLPALFEFLTEQVRTGQ